MSRVCSYDRSGIGYSQRGPKQATPREKAADLHALLKAADIEPPYVLVGHSYGGMLVHVYASIYRDDVAVWAAQIRFASEVPPTSVLRPDVGERRWVSSAI